MCSALKIPVDTHRLYAQDDPGYVAFLLAAVERTAAILREANDRAARNT